LVRSSTLNFCGDILKNKVIYGNCLKVMKDMPKNFYDTVITDPPYGLNFMGKNWDHGVPGPRYWKRCLRAAKPGAILMAFGGTRTYHRLTCAIEDAGWEIRDCIQWLYGSGFPKSLDISKAIDKEAGAKREVVGKGTAGKGFNKVKGFGENTTMGGEPTMEWNVTIPATPLAKIWAGWGTALKPSWEPIVVAMKPLDGTFAHNAEKWGVAGLNIDGGRITTQDETRRSVGGFTSKSEIYNNDEKYQVNGFDKDKPTGRFPANTILDEEAAAMLDKQSGMSVSMGGGGKKSAVWTPSTETKKKKDYGESVGMGDRGGASRFFYTAKASKSERNAGCEGMGVKHWSDGRKTEQECPHQRYDTDRKNFHPTVKPLALMEYLCRLTRTPTGGIVLDPFAGSGTTALACLNTRRKYVMIEKKKKYYKLMQARIKGRKKNRRLLDE